MMPYGLVLVVDDFAAMRDLVAHQLKSLGIGPVQLASSGDEALRWLELKNVSLILSDWSMPGMSGLELLRKVRADKRWAKLPFIMLTAELQRERVTEAIRAGVSDFLLKPFRPEEFARKVRRGLAGGSAAGAPSTPADEVGETSTERPTVLVVDDLPDNLTLASGLLRGQYAIKLATRGDKAIAVCQSTPPDLVLLDIMMPEMDGFEVCRRLKADPNTSHIPVIFLTALDEVEKTVKGLGLGACDYVAKPIEPEILKARVANALRVAQAHEDLRAQLDLAVENARLREEVGRITRHDLKNPLAAIIGLSVSLLDSGKLEDEQDRQVRTIEQAAYDMLGLIDLSNDLLKMEEGTYRLAAQQVDVAALLRRIADESNAAFGSRGIAFAPLLGAAATGSEVNGNPLLLYSALHNLVKNAAEASSAGDTVTFTIAAAENAPGHIEIGIHNRAEVPAEIASRFFEKYATFGKEGGTGLGTYSARLIARAHGGDLTMESSAAAGTTLTLRLPQGS